MTALFLGRLQPLHLGHMTLINKALAENDELIIALGSSNEDRTKSNPFTIDERKQTIESSLNGNYRIIEVPDVNNDDEWMKILLSKAKFDCVYTGSPLTKKLFLSYGYKVIEGDFSVNASGTYIRELMLADDERWKNLVPSGALKFLEKIGAEKIIKEANKK